MYEKELDLLLKRFSRNARIHQRIEDLRWGRSFKTPSDKEEESHDWVQFVQTLSTILTATERQAQQPVILPKIRELCDSVVFGSAFEKAACNIVVPLICQYSAVSNTQIDELSDLLSDLVLSYIWRVKDHAQYVLYVRCKSSGFSYSQWCKTFNDQSEQGNPWLEIGTEFPVLIRYVHNSSRQFTAAISEFLQHLEADRTLLETLLGISTSDTIVSCDPMLSDPHKDGKTVIRAKFVSGATVIYKPKELQVESNFNAFVQSNPQTGFSALIVLDRGDYGWVEDALPTESNYSAISREVGQATAWLWLLNATDMHVENLSPCSSGVRGLDLETLFSLKPFANLEQTQQSWRDQSVTSTLLYEAALSGSSTVIGYSGFNSENFTRTPYSRILFAVEDDRLVTVKISSGSEVSTDDGNNTSQVNRGVIAETFLADAENLTSLAAEFVEELSDSAPLRTIFRATDFYYQMLHLLRQPKFLRDGTLTSLELLNLHHASHLFDRAHADGDGTRVIDDEIRQLLNGDIPYFRRLAGSTELGLSAGEITEFFPVSGKGNAAHKIRSITPADICEQHSLLSVALGSPSLAFPAKAYLAAMPADDQFAEPSSRLRWLLEQVGLDLIESAYRPPDAPARWLCIPGDIDASKIRADANDTSLFAGSWGINLTLQVIESVLSPGHSKTLIAQFLEEQSSRIEALTSENLATIEIERMPLGLTGIGGLIFACSTLQSLSPSRWGFCSEVVEHLLTTVESSIEQDKWLDVVAGSAGLILGCEQAVEVLSESIGKKAVGIAEKAAEHLVRQATKTERGLAWIIPSEKLPLLGYAHGWAGIVCALQRASLRTDSLSARQVIDDCISRSVEFPERSLTEDGTWLDYRGSREKNPVFDPVNRSWCNGLAGIARGLISVQSHWSPSLEQAALQAKTSLENHDGSPLRFCCGIAGVADFTIDCVANRGVQQQQMLLEAFESMLSEILKQHSDGDILECPELAFPSLYQGKAGIVYTAARLLNEDIPSLSGPTLPQKF